jgi:hypothetical protein
MHNTSTYAGKAGNVNIISVYDYIVFPELNRLIAVLDKGGNHLVEKIQPQVELSRVHSMGNPSLHVPYFISVYYKSAIGVIANSLNQRGMIVVMMSDQYESYRTNFEPQSAEFALECLIAPDPPGVYEQEATLALQQIVVGAIERHCVVISNFLPA